MKIKIKLPHGDGITRTETSGDVKEILINEDFVHPENESIALCFRGKNSSGIVEISPAEFEDLFESVKSRIHLIKGFKMLSGSGAIKL